MSDMEASRIAESDDEIVLPAISLEGVLSRNCGTTPYMTFQTALHCAGVDLVNPISSAAPARAP